MFFAVLLGYFMMFGRISDIYLSVITLVVTLIFEKGVRATSGPEYVIGTVRLNGQNGIPGVPGLPLRIGPLDLQSIEGIFYLALFFLALAYVASACSWPARRDACWWGCGKTTSAWNCWATTAGCTS